MRADERTNSRLLLRDDQTALLPRITDVADADASTATALVAADADQILHFVVDPESIGIHDPTRQLQLGRQSREGVDRA